MERARHSQQKRKTKNENKTKRALGIFHAVETTYSNASEQYLFYRFTVTGVPTGVTSKNILAMRSGNLIQP